MDERAIEHDIYIREGPVEEVEMHLAVVDGHDFDAALRRPGEDVLLLDPHLREQIPEFHPFLSAHLRRELTERGGERFDARPYSARLICSSGV